MKQKWNKILTFVILFFITIPIFAQNIEHNLEKYWYYRERFRNEFIIVADPDLPGTNLPFLRLPGVIINDKGFTKFTMTEEPAIRNGDATTHLASYLALLATEYRLLKNYGQDYSETLTELYYALKTIERLDISAERFLRMNTHDASNEYYHNPLDNNYQAIMEDHTYEEDLNGFFIRTDLDGPICSEDTVPHDNYYNALDYNNEQLKEVENEK